MAARLLVLLGCGLLPGALATLLRSGAAHEAQPAILQPMATALLCGLVDRPELNGKRARVLRHNATSQRYTVRIEAGQGGRRSSGRASVDSRHLLALPAATASDKTQPAAACPAVPTAANSTGVVHALAARHMQNATEHPVVDGDIFHEGCSEACDHCVARHGPCEAFCHEGCQLFCKKSTAGMPGCSANEYWSARPGGPGTSSCTWDDGPNACNKWRNCQSQAEDSCPEWYLY